MKSIAKQKNEDGSETHVVDMGPTNVFVGKSPDDMTLIGTTHGATTSDVTTLKAFQARLPRSRNRAVAVASGFKDALSMIQEHALRFGVSVSRGEVLISRAPSLDVLGSNDPKMPGRGLYLFHQAAAYAHGAYESIECLDLSEGMIIPKPVVPFDQVLERLPGGERFWTARMTERNQAQLFHADWFVEDDVDDEGVPYPDHPSIYYASDHWSAFDEGSGEEDYLEADEADSLFDLSGMLWHKCETDYQPGGMLMAFEVFRLLGWDQDPQELLVLPALPDSKVSK